MGYGLRWTASAILCVSCLPALGACGSSSDGDVPSVEGSADAGTAIDATSPPPASTNEPALDAGPPPSPPGPPPFGGQVGEHGGATCHELVVDLFGSVHETGERRLGPLSCPPASSSSRGAP